MIVSHSRISTYRSCPLQYRLKYIEGLKTKPNLAPDNALFLGTAMHLGIDEGVEAAIKNYFANYETVTQAMIWEAVKLEVLIPKVKAAIPPDGIFEFEIKDPDFVGFIDYLVEVPNEEVNGYTPKTIKTYDLYDFKFSNNKDNYLNDEQLHLYKYYFMKNGRDKIRNLYYVFIPKPKIKLEPNESVDDFTARLCEELNKLDVDIVQVEYDPNKVINFLTDTKHCIEAQEFDKKPNSFCFFCPYKKFCKSDGKDTSELL